MSRSHQHPPKRELADPHPSNNVASVRGANDNPAPGEACVTDLGVALPSVSFQDARRSAGPPPELVRLVEALARRAAREDYVAARAEARTHTEKPE